MRFGFEPAPSFVKTTFDCALVTPTEVACATTERDMRIAPAVPWTVVPTWTIPAAWREMFVSIPVAVSSVEPAAQPIARVEAPTNAPVTASWAAVFVDPAKNAQWLVGELLPSFVVPIVRRPG